MAVAIATTCDLCGLAARVPLTDARAGQTHTFCCQGCRQVYQILRESAEFVDGQDLTQTPLYRQCLEMGLIARPLEADSPAPNSVGNRNASLLAESTSKDTDFSAPPKLGTGGASLPSDADTLDTTREAAFQVGGMWCTACGWLIEHALDKQRGVMGCRVFFASDVVRVTYKPARVAPEELAGIIRRLGYTAESYQEGAGASEKTASRASLTRAVIAIVFAMNAMMVECRTVRRLFPAHRCVRHAHAALVASGPKPARDGRRVADLLPCCPGCTIGNGDDGDADLGRGANGLRL